MNTSISDSQVQNLITLLSQNPDNALLRITVIRKLVEGGAKSQALAFALDLPDNCVADRSDRVLLSELFQQAGLVELSEKLQLPADTQGQIVQEKAESQVPQQYHQESPDEGETNLRIVGGKDKNDQVLTERIDAVEKSVTTFDDVGGLDEVKKDVKRRIIAPFMQSGLIARFKKRIGGGILVYGPPGCGKTLLARATAGECGLPFQAISIPEILDPMSGISERRLSQLFINAREKAPAILFFDEIDALATKRSAATATHSAQLASHFLNELDGADNSNEGLLILAATNVPWLMDSAFLRPGRFDRLFFIPPPDRVARRRIFELELADCPVTTDINLDLLAKNTSGFSGADIRNVVERAADLAIDATLSAEEEVPISQKMLHETVKNVSSSVADWLTTAKNYATYSNESGRYDEILSFLQRQGVR